MRGPRFAIAKLTLRFNQIGSSHLPRKSPTNVRNAIAPRSDAAGRHRANPSARPRLPASSPAMPRNSADQLLVVHEITRPLGTKGDQDVESMAPQNATGSFLFDNNLSVESD